MPGWNNDAEDWSAVESLDVADDELRMLVGDYQEVKFDPREVLITHQQGPVGSCRGHSGSTIVEWLYALVTGKVPTVVLSPAWMYYRTQSVDGLLGRDAGSTIMGGIQVMKEQGVCENVLWPYTPQYNPRNPSNFTECVANAEKYKISTAKRLTTYDAIRTWLGSGQGGVDCGIQWSSKYSQPVVESYSGGKGGHAIALPAVSERMDSSGRPYIWMINSHGRGSGIEGWSEWSPAFVEKCVRDTQRNVFVGVSDMPAVKPRTFDVSDWKTALEA